ncbi:hybrid sensor histidine kinase/response regulator [Aliiroseovarius crassostreae]|uniref:hybrid sensor histidine kinase/response regulator n=1 Tax=Aliiroseovarius crassostreae TaxID=154981 RepID=UPI0021FB88AA|nr:ATP-binding protein [Aliiroseovarius crassostreae]UWP90412.1 response regulator [Aliiroseovarius crassostreae]
MVVVAQDLAPRVGYIVLLALIVLAGAIALPGVPDLGRFAAVICGGALLSLALLVLGIRRWHRVQVAKIFASVEMCAGNDAAPVLVTDGEGEIIYANAAAGAQFEAKPGQTLARAFHDLFASPSAVLSKLQSRAEATSSASEDVVIRRGNIRLTVHRMQEAGFIWRVDEIGERSVAGRSGENIALPMLTVSKNGTILFMNEAARLLLGGRETTLDRIFVETPVRSGVVVQVSGKTGPVPVVVYEINCSAARKEMYLLPADAAPNMSSGEWAGVEVLPVPLLKLDAKGKISMANKRARDLLADKDAVGSLLSEQVEGLGRPVSDWLAEAHAGRHLGRTEVVRAIKPDEEVFLQISLSQMTDDDGPTLVAVIQDATELKNLEAQFVQSQKMQAIGQLAGGVAHDFNNLLTAISGHCDLLLTGRDEADPEYSDLTQIHQNANRAASLVGQLLAFSRKQTLRPEVIDLSDTLSDLTHLLNRLVGERVLLELDHDEKLLAIRADRRQLDQVIMNLVVNARDAMPDGGTVRVETRNVILDSALERDRATVPPGEYVTVRVIDHGTGIGSDKINKIFEPFFTTKKSGQGTGLGLSMAYGIIKQTGGYIFVDSVPGSGTTFTLYFPVWKETSKETHSEKEGAAAENIDATERPSSSLEPLVLTNAVSAQPEDVNDPGQDKAIDTIVSQVTGAVSLNGNETPAAGPDTRLPNPTHDLSRDSSGGVVLLVEDEAPVRAFASRALRMRGYTVLEAESAEDALSILEDPSLSVDVFVTDVVMPGMDGPTWVMKAMEKRPGVKVVFVSGYAEDSVSEHQARVPNSVFLPKPFSLTELTATVQQQIH